MLKMFKKLNRILRVVFIGFIVLYGVVKIFDVVPKQKKDKGLKDTDGISEFDEIW